jgi:hypothetical protein
MKPIKEKLKRILKYWCISYQQSRERDRLSIAMFAVLMLVYAWWVIVVL